MDIQKYEEEMLKKEKQQKIEQYRRLNCFAKKNQVVFAGSSLMEQFPIYELLLNREGDRIIYNRGIGGFITEDLLLALKVCVLDLEPSKLFLNIGTNDFAKLDFNMKEFILNYEKILLKIRKELPELRIYLMAYYPGNEEAAQDERTRDILRIRSNERISNANEEVKKLAELYGCRFIDINEKLYDEQKRLKKEYTKEGIHIYADGYAAILDDLLQYVDEI